MYGTCGTRPGWRCRRRWAWLRGLWHIWDHSQSISLEKLDIKHVPYMFLMILTNSLSCFHWLSSSTSMGVSMTPNRVQTYFSVYNTVPRASPENFISLSWKLVYFAACANSCLRSAEGPPPLCLSSGFRHRRVLIQTKWTLDKYFMEYWWPRIINIANFEEILIGRFDSKNVILGFGPR